MGKDELKNDERGKKLSVDFLSSFVFLCR